MSHVATPPSSRNKMEKLRYERVNGGTDATNLPRLASSMSVPRASGGRGSPDYHG